MAYYPTPTVNDTQDIQTIAGFVNEATGGIFWAVMLVVIWTIILIGSISELKSISRGWIFANFVASIIGSIFALLGWLQPTIMYFFIFLLAIGLAWHKLSDG